MMMCRAKDGRGASPRNVRVVVFPLLVPFRPTITIGVISTTTAVTGTGLTRGSPARASESQGSLRIQEASTKGECVRP